MTTVRTQPLVRGTERDPVLAHAGQARRPALAGLLVGLLVGLAVYVLSPAQYRTTVAIELSSVAPMVDLNPAGPRIRDVTIDTDAQLLRADEVVAAVATAEGRDPAAVRAGLTVSARPLSQVLELTYATDSAAAAQAGAETAAQTFLALREEAVIAPVREYLEASLAATRQPGTEVGDPDVTGLVPNPSDTEASRARAAITKVELAGPGRVIAAPPLPTGADRGDVIVPVVSGAALGALVGFLVGVGRCWLADRRGRREPPLPAVDAEAVTA
ncbi:MAG: hypothetical protein MUC45_00410 [Actinomycetia bacterium]|nr:hypothetical protein [Actinomycetes bacterium]